jgi:uncharacterized protein YecT (DUF1311 family)
MRATLSILLLLLTATLAAAEDDRDPIDVIWEDCAGGGEGPNAEQMLACHAEARRAWDRAADEAYADLLGRIKSPSRELLIESQRRWAVFRDAELALWRAQAESPDDLNAEVNLHAAAADIARARALYLREYRDYFWTD